MILQHGIPVRDVIPDQCLIGLYLSPNETQSVLMIKLHKLLTVSLVTMVMLLVAALDAEAQRGRGGPGGGRGPGGPGGGSSPLELLRRDEVKGEVGLTEEQEKALGEMQLGLRDDPDFRSIMERARAAGSDEERRAIFGEMRGVLDKKVDAIIKPDQRSRLNELSLQRQGMRALTDPNMAGQFNISDDQRGKIAELNAKYDEARRELRSNRDMSENERDAKTDALRADFEKNASAILSDQQRRTFEQRKGKVFAFADTQGGPQTPARSTGTARPAPTVLTPAAVAPVTPITPPDGESAVVSFGGGAGVNGAPVKEMSFNFRYAPWTDVLTLFAEAAGLTLDLNAVPPGSFNYRDNRKYSPTEALDVLNGYLIQKGFILVRRNEFLVVVNIDNGIPPNLVPTVTLEELPTRGRNELMSVIMPLVGMTAEEAATESRELLGPQGKVVALNKANKIVVTDIGSNLQRVHGLLSGIEVEGDKIFRKFELEHISVLDADAVVRDLFGLGARGVENVSGSSGSRYDPRSRYGSSSSSSSRDPRYSTPAPADPNAVVTIAIDERTNSLLVTASPANILIVEEAIEAVDLPPLEGFASRSNREPYLEVYQLETADAMEVTKTLNVMYPGTILNEDGRTRRIHIKATQDQHREIATTIRQLDGIGAGASQMAVIPLGRMDAYTATTSIQSLFLGDGDSAPVVQPHPSDNALIVRGSNEQVTQIKLLVTQLEPGEGGGYGGEGKLRTIPLGGRDPEAFLKALEGVWNIRGRNRIRTVVPSATGAIRDRRVPSSTSPFLSEEPAATGGEAAAEPTQPRKPTPPAAAPGSKPATPPATNTEKKPSQSARRAPYEDAGPSRRTVAGFDTTRDLALAFADDPFSEVSFADDEQEAPAADSQPGDGDAAKTQADDAPSADVPANDANLNQELNQLFIDLDASEAERDAAAAASKSSNSDAPIAITIQGGNLLIVSDDEDALDRLEDVIASLASAMPPKTQWTVFYLRSADATQTAAILERLFPTSSVTTSLGGSDGGFMSELSGGLSSMGRGIMDMSGLNSVLSGPQTLRIIPDVRSNSLFVTGPPHEIDEVEDVLRILDASELPEQLRDRAPRYIAVEHAEVNEVAEIIRDVFKEELTPPAPVQQGRGGGGGNPLAALMGGGGSTATAPKVQMTLGIDRQNSRLYVSCNEPMFLQVSEMVKEIDAAALGARRAIRVVPLQHASSLIVQQTIGALMPRVKVSTSSTSGRASSPSGNSDTNNAQQSADQLRQQFIQQALQRQGAGAQGGGRGPGGGGGAFGRPGGGSTGGGGSGRGTGGGGGGRGPGGGRR
jgi:type II secretory pathway component GspD/PulD (secretin)